MASKSSETDLSTSTSNPRWDVYLSFSGIDTRSSFVSHLYSALGRSGVRVFIDNSELLGGELISSELFRAIQESKIYIVVLSENYAFSTWCLDELVKILDCGNSMKRLVIPVFYHIDPSAVRHQSGSFNEAFRIHEIRFAGDIAKVKDWRLALNQVADIQGFIVNEMGIEADMMSKVVDRVLLKIYPSSLVAPIHLVGLDSRIEDIRSLIESGREGVTMIGIYGMAGIGKTTLAIAVYNEISHNFEGSCFLANVREVSGQPNGLEHLQRQLITDVLKVKTSPIDSVYHVTKLIRQRICSKKVLVVVDDLNDQKQLDSLVVAPFAPGSVIILTTRREDLLDIVGVEARYRYMLNELDFAESMKLFNQHAFGDKIPSKTFIGLSTEIVRHAGGLPLALIVYASKLRGYSETKWKQFNIQLQYPNYDILEPLRISFDALDPMLQEIFLDISCFFIGMAREDVVKIMETCYTGVDKYISTLLGRCLIRFNDENELQMHDLIRDMGRKIALNNSPVHPGRSSRFWNLQDICHVLMNDMATDTVEGIVPHNHSYSGEFGGVRLDTEIFEKMPKLRYLYLEDLDLTGSFHRIFKNLRWLHWSNCPLGALTSDFCPQELVILELPRSNINRWDLNKVLDKLKTLDLSHSHELSKTPDFKLLPSLETLILEGCVSLTEIDASIENLVNLVSLNLSNCESLKRIPNSISKLSALESLNLLGCNSLEALPMGLLSIESLTQLRTSDLDILNLSHSKGGLSKLLDLFTNDKNDA